MKGGVLTIHEDYFLLTGGIERWLYRVARKHAGQQEAGWQFTMRQLYEKSGIDVAVFRLRHRRPQGRRSGFATRNTRRYIHKNEEGDEVIHFLKRDTLDVNDPRYETPRHPRRRVARGITSKSLKFNAIAE